MKEKVGISEIITLLKKYKITEKDFILNFYVADVIVYGFKYNQDLFLITDTKLYVEDSQKSYLIYCCGELTEYSKESYVKLICEETLKILQVVKHTEERDMLLSIPEDIEIRIEDVKYFKYTCVSFKYFVQDIWEIDIEDNMLFCITRDMICDKYKEIKINHYHNSFLVMLRYKIKQLENGRYKNDI
jgi:hypothetical protein